MGRENPIQPENIKPRAHYENVFSLHKEKLTEGRVGALVKVILSDPTIRARFYQLFEDKKILESAEVNLEEAIQKVTPLFVTLMRDESMRHLLMDSMLGDMRDDSKSLKTAIEDEVKEAMVFNRLVIGAGVHAAILNNAITKNDLNSKNLTVEASDKVSRNFSSKQFVSINTRNQPHTRDIPIHELKRGNLNFFGKDAPVQLPYIEPELFPSANTIAEVATANQYLSNSETLFESQVDRVLLPEDDKGSDKWPAKYKVTFTDGTFVFADEVILTTGLGTIEYPKQFDEATLKIVKRDSDISPEGVPAGIMTYEEFAEFMTDSPTPLRHFVGKKIDIAGGGDGASTILEELLRFGKRKSYKLDVAQTGTPSKIHWIGQKIKDSRQYKSLLSNERYLMLAQEMPLSAEELEKYEESTRKELERKIEPKDGYLVQIRDSDNLSQGRYRVTYLLPDKTIEESYTDFVIIAAGYKNKIGSLFGKESNPFDSEEDAEVVKGDVAGVPVPVAVKLKNHGVYAAGPASMGRVLKDAEVELASLSGIPPNRYLQSVAIATFGPRTEKLAEILAQEPHRNLEPFSKESPALEIEKSEDVSSQYLIDGTGKKTYQEQPLVDIKIKIAIGSIFEKCNLLGKDIDSIDIIVEKNPKNKNSAFLSFSPNIKNWERIKDILVSEGLADDLINSVTQGRWRMVINVPFNNQGQAKIQSINLKRELYK